MRAPNTNKPRSHVYAIPFRSVSADIRVRIDGVEDEHGIIKVDKTGKVCGTIARLFKLIIPLIGMRAELKRG